MEVNGNGHLIFYDSEPMSDKAYLNNIHAAAVDVCGLSYGIRHLSPSLHAS
jgi:hypothetical protein